MTERLPHVACSRPPGARLPAQLTASSSLNVWLSLKTFTVASAHQPSGHIPPHDSFTRDGTASSPRSGWSLLVLAPVLVPVLVLVLVGLLGGLRPAQAQPADAASAEAEASRTTYPKGLLHPMVHYDPDETPSERQVWSIAQDTNRVVYVAGGTRGVQTFDGEHWHRIEIHTPTEDDLPSAPGENAGDRSPDRAGWARSVTRGHDDRMYVGTEDDIGVLRPNASGTLAFVSLLPKLPEAQRAPDAQGTGTVWFAGATSEATFFQTQRALYRWSGTRLDVWRSENSFHTAHIVDNRLFVRDFDRGLLELVGNALRPAPGGRTFEDETIYGLELHASGRMMAVSGRGRAYFVSEGGARPIPLPADSVLQTTQVYASATVSLGTGTPGYALATLGRGVIIIDAQGHVVRHLRPGMELPDGVVNTLYTGREGELWIGFNNEGLMRIGGATHLERYGARTGLRGQIQALATSKSSMFVGTGAGLYRLDQKQDTEAADRSRAFAYVPGSSVVGGLATTSRGLAVNDLSRVWMLEDNGGRTDLFPQSAHTMYQPPSTPDRLVLARSRGGLSVLEATPGGWSDSPVEGSDATVHTLVEYRGEIWAGAAPHTLLRFSVQNRRIPRTVRHTELDSRIATKGFNLSLFQNQLFLISRSGIYTWNADRETFERSLEWTLPVDGPMRAFLFARNLDGGDAWVIQNSRLYRGTRQDGALAWVPVPGIRFPSSEPVRLHPGRDGGLWIGRGDDLLRYDPTQTLPPVESPRLLLRRVRSGLRGDIVQGIPPNASVSLDYDENDPTIEFAAPNFDTEPPTVYRTQLEGRDDAWTAWTTDARIQYLELREGTYTLNVQARSSDGAVGAVSSLSITVVPPWYRTGWAYLAYAILGLGLLSAGVRYRTLTRKRQQAEEETTRRSRQLRDERRLTRNLKHANERLRELNRMKEYFIANTSHELRTPLTNIIGFARVLKDDAAQEMRPHLRVIEQNGFRLLHTLTSILDLANLQSGTMRPVLEWADLRTPVRDATRDLESEANAKNLHLTVDVPEQAVHAHLDVHFVEQITHHLLDNAIKFTPEGRVEVSLRRSDANVSISVTDTGIGIDPSFLPDLFVGFQQESRGRSRSHEGNGVGLAIVGRLVDALDGTVSVSSTKDEGSRFTVTLPRQGPATRQASLPRENRAPDGPDGRHGEAQWSDAERS